MSLNLGNLMVTISAKDQLSSALAMAGNAISQFGGMFGPLGNIIQGFAAGPLAGLQQVFMETVNVFRESVSIAADLESLRIAFDRLREGSALSLEALQEAARGTVSEIDLITAANRAMMLGIDPSFLPEMMELSRKAATAMGIDAKKAFDDMVTGMGRCSKKILDNLGIIVDTRAAYETFAASVGKTVGELTEAEKVQAFQTAAMKAAREHAKKLGDAMGTAKNAFARMKAAVMDAKSALGEALLPIITPIIEGFASFISQITGPLVGAFSTLISWLQQAWQWFCDLPAPIQVLISPLLALAANIKQIVSFLQGLWSIISEALLPIWKELCSAFSELWTALEELFAPLMQTEEGLLANQSAMASVANIIVLILKPMLQLLIGVIQTLTGIVKALRQGWEEDWGGIRSTLEWIWENVLKPILKTLGKILFSDEPGSVSWAIKKFKETWERMWSAIKGAYDTYIKPVIDFIQALIDKLKEAWDWWQKVFGGSPGGLIEESLRHAAAVSKRYAADIAKITAVGAVGGYVTPSGPVVTQVVTISVEASIGGSYDVKKLARDLKDELDELAYRNLRARARPGVVWE